MLIAIVWLENELVIQYHGWLYVFFINILLFIIAVANAVSILGEYVKDEPWLKLLCKHLKYFR